MQKELPQKTFKSFADFLQDKKFVQWKLFPTNESEAYWNNFIEQYPNLAPLLKEAEKHFVNIRIEKDELSDTEKLQLWQNIQQGTYKKTKRTFSIHQKWITIVAAACAILVFVIGLNLYLSEKKSNNAEFGNELIVGNTQSPENIQLITGNTISTFEQDIEIKVDNGVALIDEGSQNEKKIDIIDNTTINKLIVPYGKRSKIQLSDGSIVWLNSGSTLEFPSKFAKESREIKLQGELYIEVAPNKKSPLYVHTPRFSVEAVGTAFNVSAYNASELAAVLVEGQINVHSKNNVKNVKPNEIATIDEIGNISTKQIFTESYTSWRSGYLLFEDTPMATVLTQIGRYYNLKFKYSENSQLQSITCTGKLYLSDNLDHIMRSLSLLSNTTYNRKDNTIIITN
ncbi:MAG: FecR domain-containing protein [Bacteroidia bacterium]|nr:FecR domain-containing protein [Bacteroidia bacterium]